MGVTPATSVNEFFRQVLIEAMTSEGVEVSEHTEFYLVDLLGEFARSRITDEPLGLRLAESGFGSERVAALKEVGDTSLYVTGFFAESLEKGLVASDYYIQLGESAYRELSRRLSASSVAEVYDELAAKFPRFVDVLASARSHMAFASSDVTSLYQEWQRSRAEWVERRLRALGVIVLDPDKGYVQ
jgi:hypothetical protein